jgi:hypothetical protein
MMSHDCIYEHPVLTIDSVNLPSYNFDILILPRDSNPEHIHQNQSLPLENSLLSNLNPNQIKLSFSIGNASFPKISSFTRDVQFPIISNPNQKITLDISFKVSFLESLSLNFTSIIRRFIIEFLLLPQCSKEMKKSLSVHKINRYCVQDLIKVVHQFSSKFCSILNEDSCVSLLLRTYDECFGKVPNQKKFRIQSFTEIIAKTSSCIKNNPWLMNLQNRMKDISSKCKQIFLIKH